MLKTIIFLTLAALLEVGGDAAIRRGLVQAAPRWFVLGAAALVTYGVAVNADRSVDFGRLMGAYIAVFFVASQAIAYVMFGERPSMSLLLGGMLIVGGGIVIQAR